jgi:tRNA pseudouridine38-40 synthase
LKLTLEYDGTDFRGWAAQPGLRTVEGELRRALEEAYGMVDRLAVAGRTDAGVHALGQVASVDTEAGPPPERAAEALNALLPDDVAVLDVAEASPDFHARHSAHSRSYRYRIFRRRAPSPFEARRAWWYPKPLDEERLADSADLLLGDHDFRPFTPAETQHEVFTRRVERAEWHRRGDALEFEITANSFLRHMVRILVGTMVEAPPARIAELLDGAHARADAGTTAPPWGLYLERVHY